jgi:hypothetical protein
MIGVQEIIIILIALIFLIGPVIFLIAIVIRQTIRYTKKKCPKCGRQNDKDAKFCGECGFKFVQEN